MLDILPRIGAEFYEKVSDGLQNSDSESILTDKERKFLDGGYYTTENGEKRHHEGVKTALCYYAYARFIRNHSLQTTPFGVVSKKGDESSIIDRHIVAAMSEDARKIADEYMLQSLTFWNEVKGKDDIKPGRTKARRKFIPIG